jgi:arabinogalactan oligomer / maltooligosaccharide transport system permease protein
VAPAFVVAPHLGGPVSRGGRPPPMWVVLAVHAGLFVFTVAALYPVLWVVKMALAPTQAFASGAWPLPTAVSADNFIDVVGTTDASGWLFGKQLFNSVVVSVGAASFGLILSTTSAYAMSRWSFPGKQRALDTFLLTQMFPTVVMAIPLYLLLDWLRLLDTLSGLVLVYAASSVPFSTWTLKGFFDTIPRELEEAARLDGASRIQTFFLVVLPLARPAIAVTALFCFMNAWNEFVLAATFMGAQRSFTLPVVLQRYVSDYGTEWGHFAAGAIIVSIPVIALFFALQRQFVEGLTAGGVKG